MDFWKDLNLQTMIRATKGKSMDGEVLIIGMMVGWSGSVPKGLTCVDDRLFPRLFFWSFFSKAFFCGFLGFSYDFARFWEAKMEAKIDFWEVFFRRFFRVLFGIDF